KRDAKEVRAKTSSKKEIRTARSRSVAKKETVAKRVKPSAKPETMMAKAMPTVTPQAKAVDTASASVPEAALDRAASIEPVSLAQKEENALGGFASNADRRTALRALESRMASGNVVLARMEEKLAGLMKELEKREKDLARDKAAIEGGGIQDSTVVDRYNSGVSRYNKLLAYARQVAAECDSVRRENHELSVKYRSLAVR
ncbi:MAG: hypothetical protein OEV28_08705, partial [Nitrospirota bacterium]|nr:hypothetical protein [Nitrospirota bacterium]